MDVFLVKITNKENVEKVQNKERFTHKDIYNFETEIEENAPVFIVFSGDKSKIDWPQGLVACGKITKAPYDKGYDKEKSRYFKIDINPLIVLEKPLDPKFTKLHPKYQNDLYDVPYVGANHFPNQAIAKASGKGAKALFLLFQELNYDVYSFFQFPFLKGKSLKDEFINYLSKKNRPSTVGSYINSLEQIPEFLRSIKVKCPDPWDLDLDIDALKNAANFVKEESKKESNKMQAYSPISHWNNGWFVSGVSNLINFLSNDEAFQKSEFRSDSDKVDFSIEHLSEYLQLSNLQIKKNILFAFTASLLSKNFVILTGLSGSGKTKIAEAFSLWLSSSSEQICLVSVGADWTNRDPLLGYPNALQKGSYIKPDNGVLDLIIKAENDSKNPYFLILDEMNLSHVERYFSDFLSAMESTTGYINLHPDVEDWKNSDIPSHIQLPKNLFIIGTVNIDETTYMFSPKVLDRANVIEFRVSEEEMMQFLESSNEINLEILSNAGSSMGESFVEKAIEFSQDKSNLKDELIPFFKQLQEAGAEFGYRTASEISTFIKKCSNLVNGDMTRDQIVDAAIMQKLLPKLHGSRNKIEHILKDLGNLCLIEKDKKDFPESDAGNLRYPVSYEKLKRMHKRVISDGFTSYAEA